MEWKETLIKPETKMENRYWLVIEKYANKRTVE